MNKSRRLLIILTKNPEAGMVKTRLARSIGNEKALEVYETLRCHTARITAHVQAERIVYYSSFIPTSTNNIFLTSTFNTALQQGNDFGERMLHTIENGCAKSFNRIVLIGTDCYELTTEIIEEAFTLLEDSDAVIGPATDGGFYLIGMRRPVPEIFLNRQWSTSSVLEESVAMMQKLHIRYQLLQELSDIDTYDDLKKSALWTCKP